MQSEKIREMIILSIILAAGLPSSNSRTENVCSMILNLNFEKKTLLLINK